MNGFNRDTLCLLLALGLSLTAAWWQGTAQRGRESAVPSTTEGLIDASGHWVATAPYQRIAALSTVACQVLPDLIAVDRIILVSHWHQQSARTAFRTAGIPTIGGADQIEILVAARPDLVLINNFQMQPAVVERLRALGLTVFDLGGLDGPPSLLPAIRNLGTLLQVPDRGNHLADRLQFRLQRVAATIAPEQRRRALYVDRHGDQLIGGTRGSSFYHLLTYAGLDDVAADAGLPPWPQLRMEQVLKWQPEVLVTSQGMREPLLALPGMTALNPTIVELPRAFDSTGPELLDHVELLFESIYGPTPER